MKVILIFIAIVLLLLGDNRQNEWMVLIGGILAIIGVILLIIEIEQK